MKKSLLSAILFLLAFGAQAQTADAIIAKHLEAMGGEAWETIKTNEDGSYSYHAGNPHGDDGGPQQGRQGRGFDDEYTPTGLCQ